MEVVRWSNFSHAYGNKAKYGVPLTPDGKIRRDQPRHFIGCNFAQKVPHTTIFVGEAPLKFTDCNLTNVSVPDGAEIEGGNLAQIVRTEVEDPVLDAEGRPVRSHVNLLHDCGLCASAVFELRQAIADKDPGCFDGKRWKHHNLKLRIRARRARSGILASDLEELRLENMAALAKHTRDESETEGWFLRLWTATKTKMGIS